MRKTSLNIMLVVCVFVMTLTGLSVARTIYVDPNGSADFTGIQAAINDASYGDEIEVAPGIYYESINFNGKAITLRSIGGPEITTIDANGANTAVKCISGEDHDTVLDGFTITGGYAAYGGGMYCENSSPSVTNCNFSSNSAYYFGGGMYCRNSSPAVSYCNFTGNEVTTGSGGGMCCQTGSPIVTDCNFTGNSAETFGGGMFNDGSYGVCKPTVTKCIFQDNSAVYKGGGICNSDSDNPNVTNCTFIGNSADHGGGMYSYKSSPIVTNCLFYGNSAGNAGGAIGNEKGYQVFTNCTFAANSAASQGGGMWTWDYYPTVTNCIFWGNTAPTGPQIYGGSPTVTYCDVQSGWDGTGNIDANPLFVNAQKGNLRLRACSPCVDAGNNTAVPAGVTTDLDANPRRVDDEGLDDKGAGTAPIVDMGAYERQVSTLAYLVHNITKDVYYCSPQEAIDDADNADQIQVGPGTYDPIDFNGKAITLLSSDGPEVTIIDAGGFGTVVTCDSSQTILEGFTITGGNADRGGGMYCKDSSPTVRNCTFSGNKVIDRGGGMYCYNSSPAVTNCTFIGNLAVDGGGMFNSYSDPNVTNCEFYVNSTPDKGGGICNDYSDNPNVTNCTFIGNSAVDGGGMYNYKSTPKLTNCRFTDNSGISGGGLCNANASSPNVTNCTFSGNSAESGGGMYNYNNSNPTVTNCTFSGNRVDYGGGGMYNYGSSPTVVNCILWGNTAPNGPQIYGGSPTVTYCDVQGGWDGTTNIADNPLFVNAGRGDLCLASYHSPCVDAGSNNVSGLPATDLAGSPRKVDGDENGSERVDMGAFEYGEYRVHNITQGALYITINGAIRDANNGDEIEVSPGAYYESINFNGRAIRLYSSGGPEVTTIDANGIAGAYHVVQCRSGEGANTILEGFTITGGNANGPDPTDRYGGGLYCENSSPTVTRCGFTNNSASVGGGGIYCGYSSSTVDNCAFTHNSAEYGGGMCNSSNSNPTIINCTFSGNTADISGGATYSNASSPVLTNCILWGDIGGEIFDVEAASTNVTYSNVQGGWDGEGNIDANPLFRNLAKGNLALVPWSPCIDAGNNDVVLPGAMDIAGLARVTDGDCNATTVVDMGTHELQHTYMGDFDSNCNVNWADFAVLASAWLADPLSENWDPACDIGIPADRRIDSRDLEVLAGNWLRAADTSITCDAAVLYHVFGLDSVAIFDILGAAPCSLPTDDILQTMKEAGCPMLELVEIDADASGKPVIPDGFHALGSYSFTTAGCQFAARELLPGMLASPLDYVQVCDTDYWKPVAPTGYVWLGLVEKSVKPGLDDVRCVKKELAGPGMLGVEVEPPKADDPNHIIPADTNGIYIGTFGLSDCPQSAPLYVLDARVAQKTEHLTLQDIDQLIQDYGPVLKLHPDEDYFPDDPEWVLDNGVRLEWGLVENDCLDCYSEFTQTYVNSMPTSSTTLMDDVEYVVNTIKPNPPYNSSESFKYWLNIPDVLKPGNLSRAKAVVRVVPWNHFFTEIQFWFFYPFNGPARVAICPIGVPNRYIHAARVGRHYGDWEGVCLRFLNSSKELVSVYMSAHDEGYWFGDADFGDTLHFLGQHPVVYSGKYSHAQYSTVDMFYYHETSEWWGDARLYDLTGNGITFPSYLMDKYRVVSYDVYPMLVPDWVGFTAYWGQYEKLAEEFCYLEICDTYKEVGSGPASLPVRKEWQVGVSGEALGY